MRRLLLILIVLPFLSRAEKPGCKDVKEGIFKQHDVYGSLRTIIRTSEKQTETWARPMVVIEYDVQWTSECSFKLFNRKTLKGNDSLINITECDTIYNQIVEVNDYWHKISSSMNGVQPATEVNYFNVDTVSVYKDLIEFDKFREYMGPTSGGTFVGYNYAVTYRQNTLEPDKYMITFLEAIVVNEKPKFKILDNIFCTLDTSQRIAIANCRLSDEYQKEIIATYIPGIANDEACITQAWRFNKLKMKIEPVNPDCVKYKISDKRISMWNN
jgi:hypothetical protein